MLTKEENQLLMQVGPGTPMGNLLRRYWMPVAAVEELNEQPTKQIRLMGEDLALYKDKSGTYGCVDLHCPHRRADLSYGMVEECGLRCNYHGWAFDEKGNCIEQPFEAIAHPDANFRDRVKIKAYRVEAKAGLLWVYMGPEPAPCLWDWDVYHRPGFKQVILTTVPCNWLQCAENNLDPVHVQWLHSAWSQDLRHTRDPKNRPNPNHLEIGIKEFEWGYYYTRVMEGDAKWHVYRVAIWPNCFMPGNSHFEFRVPIDDYNTLSLGWVNDPLPGDQPFEQERIPYWHSPLTNPETGRWVNSNTVNQDIIAWVGQGAQSDRENEHLGESDRGVIALRRQFAEDIRVVEDGGDPKGILRDATRNYAIEIRPGMAAFGEDVEGGPRFLPTSNAELIKRLQEEQRRDFGSIRGTASRLWAGQPKEIAEEYARIYEQRQAVIARP
jgi:5,5'-dehydrodivanillate O-demethylase oxygenase subunit